MATKTAHFKEQISSLEQLARQQIQIYPDSIDYGVPATPEIKDVIRWCVKSLPNMVKPTWKADKPYVQRRYESTVMWDKESGAKICILYTNDKETPGVGEYFSISLGVI